MDFSTTLSPSQVASSLVGQYYDALQANPEFLQELYSQDSALSINDNNTSDFQPSSSKTATGPAEIAGFINVLTQKVAANQIHLLSVEAFTTIEDSIIGVVLGVLINADNAQKFTQTFVLRPNGTDGEYYIRNDIWRFSGPEAVGAPAAPEAPAAEEEVVEAAVEEPEEVTESGEEESEEVEEEAEEEEEAAAEEADSVSQASSKQSSTPPAKEAPKATPANGGSWAALAATKKAATTAAAPQKVVPTAARASPKPATVVKKEEKKEETPKKPTKRDEAAKSKLVLKVRSQVTDDQVKAIIPAALSKHLISLRNNSDRGMVFVDFSDAAAEVTLNAEQLFIGKDRVHVEKQKEKTAAKQ